MVTPIDSVQTPATRGGGQERGQAVKAENLEGQAVKGTSQIRKSQGSSKLKVNRIPNLIKARYHILYVGQVRSRVKALFEWRSSGQGPKSRSKFLTAVAGVCTESQRVTSPLVERTSGSDW